MNRIFADTFYWIALTSRSDPAHDWAIQIIATVVTTQEVLTEYLNYFCAGSPHLRRQAAIAVIRIQKNPNIRVIPQSDESFLAGLELYRSRSDKEYSLTDCISMYTMRQQRLTDVLTNDRHFEQEGFRALFRIH